MSNIYYNQCDHFPPPQCREIWEQSKASFQDKKLDIHSKLMRRYKEAPEWWFWVILLVNIVAAIFTCEYYKEQLQLPWWGVLLACAIAFIFTLPIGVLTAIANQAPHLNIITEYVIGYIYPGYPVANMCFKVYGNVSMKQAVTFLQDFKLGHYMKIPPRTMFIAQGDRTDKRDTSAFNTWKDIIILGNVDDGMTKGGATSVQPLPLSRRKYLANFFGRAQGKIGRLQLIELAKKYPEKLECPELKFNGPNKLGRKEYFEHLRNARFCLAPRGESSWTLRFYESFFVECVPVLLSDQAELPFQNVVDYTQISIKWPSTHIGPQLLGYLESIPDEDVERMIAHGRQVRCLWAYAPESQPCSAINGIFWELQRKVRHFHQSAETFWLHNRTIVNRELVPFSLWKPPMPLP